jgi:hypothetical protein
MVRRHARRALPPLALALFLAACDVLASPSPAASEPHAEHDVAADRVIAALGEELGMQFDPAGPHHRVGRAPDGTELDLVGIPVEETVLSLPRDDPEAGQAYLPHLRELLGGPDRVYEWVSAMLACRADAGRACEERFAEGGLAARFSDGGPAFVVVTVSRAP